MAISIRRRTSKKDKALRAVTTTGKKAAKAKVVVGTGKAARKGAGTAAKGGAIAWAFAKARKPVLAVAAVAGGAAVALKLKSRRSSSGEADLGTAAESTPPSTVAGPHPSMAAAANGTPTASGTPAS